MATTNPGIPIKPPFGGQRCDLDRVDVQPGSAYLLRNWFKRDGKFKVRPGFSNSATLGSRATGMIQYDHTSGLRYTVIGTTTKWFYYDLTSRTWEDISGTALTGTEATHQMFRTFLKSGVSYLVGTNWVDAPQKWDGDAATYSAVGGSPPKARCLAVCNNRLLLGNTYTSIANPMQIDVSAFNDFEAGWGAVQTVNLMDTPGEIVELREFGNLLTVVYKTDSLYLCSAQAGLEPFAFQLRWPEIKAPASPRLVVTTPTEHVYMARDGSAWRFDGVNLTYGGPHIHAHMRQTADLDMLTRGYGFYDAVHNEVWFIYRSRGSADPDMGIVIDLDDWSLWPVSFNTFRPTAGYGAQIMTAAQIGDLFMPIGSMTGTLSDLTHVYQMNLLVGKGGEVCNDDDAKETCDDNGNPVDVAIETGMVEQNNPTTVVESEHFLSGGQSATLQLGYSQDGEDPIYTAAQTVPAGCKPPPGHRTTARFFSLKLSFTASNRVQWRGSRIYGAGRGLK